MRRSLLLDTGPLVATLFRRDQYHDWARNRWDGIELPVLTCEPVITEACFLLRAAENAIPKILEFVQRGVIRFGFHLQDEIDAVAALMRRYSNFPMSLSDACLVRMAELYPESMVWTLDSDFRHYRKNRRQVIPLLIPSDRK